MKYRFYSRAGFAEVYEEIVEVPNDESVEDYFDPWVEQNVDFGFEKIEEVE